MELFPLNLEDLVNARSVESIRIEYKVIFDERNKWSTIATISAFANDLQNLNGGFIIIGIEADNGSPKLPPCGLRKEQLEGIQKEIRIACTRIDPEYQPLVLPMVFHEKDIIVIWAPAGDTRPYKSPDVRDESNRCFHVRQGPETIKAKGDIERQLIELTARIPFDDRRSLTSSVLDLSPILVKRFLQEIGSDLLNITPLPSDTELYKSLRIVSDYQGTTTPKNIGLLFFNERPDRFFNGCAFDIVQFGDDAGGNLIEERRFNGPLDNQVTSVVDYLDSLTNVQLRKLPGKAQVERTVAYPYEALEEAIANAAYHRSYESSSEPNKVYLYPDRLEIISYPGAVQGITIDHLKGSVPIPPVPARNRRIGEFLKELGLAEMRGTGIPKIRRVMSQNGSADPIIDFDPDRTYFRVVLPAHPRYRSLHALRESSYLWSIGEKKASLERLNSVFNQQPGSGAIAAQLIQFLSEIGDLSTAEKVFNTYHQTNLKSEVEQPYLRYFRALFTNDQRERARKVIDMLPENEYLNTPLDVAIAFKRLKVFDRAHTILSRTFGGNETDPDFLQNFSEVKMGIANEIYSSKNRQSHTINRLRTEAVELLRRAISLSKDSFQKAWCYFDLARVLKWLHKPSSQVRESFENAIELLPTERTFREAFDRWRKYHN